VDEKATHEPVAWVLLHPFPDGTETLAGRPANYALEFPRLNSALRQELFWGDGRQIQKQSSRSRKISFDLRGKVGIYVNSGDRTESCQMRAQREAARTAE
jgi:hypothetical protein